MRFDLNYRRGRWHAVFSHENGDVYANVWHENAQVAVLESVKEVLKGPVYLPR